MMTETHERPPDTWITRGNAATTWVIAILASAGVFYLVATNTTLGSVPVMVLVFSTLATSAVTCVITQNTTRGKATPVPDDDAPDPDPGPDPVPPSSVMPLMMSGPVSPTVAPGAVDHGGHVPGSGEGMSAGVIPQ